MQAYLFVLMIRVERKLGNNLTFTIVIRYSILRAKILICGRTKEPVTTLRRMREELALTIEEVAKSCGVRRQTVWLWENGKFRPSPLHRRKLAEIYKTTPKEILGAIEETRKESEKDWAAA